MDTAPVEEYLASIDPEFEPFVRTIDAAIRAAGTDFDVAVKYRILIYTLEQRWHGWVCALDVNKKGAHLRFLNGVALADPAGLMRRGTATATTIDYPTLEAVDPDLITSYVKEAVEKHPAFIAAAEKAKAAKRS